MISAQACGSQRGAAVRPPPCCSEWHCPRIEMASGDGSGVCGCPQWSVEGALPRQRPVTLLEAGDWRGRHLLFGLAAVAASGWAPSCSAGINKTSRGPITLEEHQMQAIVIIVHSQREVLAPDSSPHPSAWTTAGLTPCSIFSSPLQGIIAIFLHFHTEHRLLFFGVESLPRDCSSGEEAQDTH